MIKGHRVLVIATYDEGTVEVFAFPISTPREAAVKLAEEQLLNDNRVANEDMTLTVETIREMYQIDVCEMGTVTDYAVVQ